MAKQPVAQALQTGQIGHSQLERNAFYSKNALKLGLFGANCASSMIYTTVPERWSGSWEDGLRLAQLCDEYGIEFLLPLARWKGYGGVTDYQGVTLETITWATGMLASTQRVTVLGTVHVPLFHPLIAAKQMVTADQIGHGRFGLNIVAGWNQGEFKMFGVVQKDHEKSYAHAQEWIDVVRTTWDRDDFDYEGEFFKLQGVREKPKPYGGTRPVIMNAGSSPTGRNFAMNNSDVYFTGRPLKANLQPMIDEIATVNAAAHALGREIDVFTQVFVTCRPTRAEAEEYVRHCIDENADWDALDARLDGMRSNKVQPSKEEFERARAEAPRAMIGIAVTGDPDDVAQGLANLANIGIRGVGMTFINFVNELPYFNAEVLPRLQRMGLRTT